jgi:hypothetical protein
MSHGTPSTHNVAEKERLNILIRHIYTSEIQSKCKFLYDSALHSYNHEDQNHKPHVILYRIGMDPSSTLVNMYSN